MTSKKPSIEAVDITARFFGEYDGGIIRADVTIGGCLELRSVSLVQGMLTFPHVNRRDAVAVSERLGGRIKAAILTARSSGGSRSR